jgi:hypothetical protein
MLQALSFESVAAEVTYHQQGLRTGFLHGLRRRRPVNNPAPQGPQHARPVNPASRPRVRAA